MSRTIIIKLTVKKLRKSIVGNCKNGYNLLKYISHILPICQIHMYISQGQSGGDYPSALRGEQGPVPELFQGQSHGNVQLMAHSGLDIPASMAVMNLKPGFVTPFGMLNDGELLVDAFLDRDFLNPPA
jgi:hypothetical protein